MDSRTRFELISSASKTGVLPLDDREILASRARFERTSSLSEREILPLDDPEVHGGLRKGQTFASRFCKTPPYHLAIRPYIWWGKLDLNQRTLSRDGLQPPTFTIWIFPHIVEEGRRIELLGLHPPQFSRLLANHSAVPSKKLYLLV